MLWQGRQAHGGSAALTLLTVVAVCAALVTGDAFANPIQDENARPGDSSWTIAKAPEPWVDGNGIEGYASKTSATPGERIDFFVRAKAAPGDPAPRYRIEIHRLGWYGGSGGRRMACLPSCTTDEPAIGQLDPPAPNPTTGFVDAAWTATDGITIPSDWVSGYYMAELVLTNGLNAGKSNYVGFTIRPPPGNTSAIAIQVPVTTEQAYNPWGGKSLYGFNSTANVPALKVSMNRPLQVKNANVPDRFYVEYQLVRFLEREGYDVTYYTDIDVSRTPSALLDHRLVMSAGHDEYWTKEMRDGWEAARAAGTNLAFLGANAAYWQIRLEDLERTVVGYKDRASEDPEPDPAKKTTRFRDLNPPRPECQLIGAQYGADDPAHNSRDYTVLGGSLSDPWMAGAGLTAGQVISGLVGYEWDAIVPGCISQPVTRFFNYDGTARGESGADAVRYTATSGARVFAMGTIQFSWALDDYPTPGRGPTDAGVQQFFRNALSDLQRPAAPISVMATQTAPNTARIDVARPPDTRVTALRVYRKLGTGAFSPGDPGVSLVCVTAASSCTDSGVPGHRTYRYAAVTVDRWGNSDPTLSSSITLPDEPPSVTLTGSTSTPTVSATTYTAQSIDPDGDAPTYSWKVDGVTQAGQTGASLQTSFARPGQHTVTVTVTDGQGGSDTKTATVTATNRPPTAAPTFSPDAPATGEDVAVEANASDPDGGTLTYAWKVDGEPQPGETAPRLTRAFSRAGRYVISVTVGDGQGAFTSEARAIDVGNRPPAISISGPASVASLVQADYRAEASDPEGTALTYRWALDERPMADATGSSVSLTLPDPGTHRLSVTATDEDGAPASAKLAVQITNRPELVLAAIPTRAEVGRAAAFTATVTDTDSPAPSLAWSFTGGGRPVRRTASPTGTVLRQTFRAPGRAKASLRVREGSTPGFAVPLTIVGRGSVTTPTFALVGALPGTSGPLTLDARRQTCKQGKGCRFRREARWKIALGTNGDVEQTYRSKGPGALRITATAQLAGTTSTITLRLKVPARQ